MGTVASNFLPSTTGLNLGSEAQKWDGFFQQVQAEQINNRVYADSFSGANMGAKIESAISAAASTGATIDARGFEGAQAISSTIVVNKPVVILLGYADITTSVTRAFDVTQAGAASSIIGVSRGSTTTGGTRIIAADNTVTELIRIQGTNTGTRTSLIRLSDLTIEGSDTADSQIGLLTNFATSVLLSRVQFAELGQAEDIDDVFRFTHRSVNYFHCGTGDTAATATVRIENRTTPGTPSEQFRFERCLWEGDNTGGNNKQGIGLYLGPAVTQVWLEKSKLDYGNTNPDFRIVAIEETDQIFVGPGNFISATSITSAAAVVDITGDAGNRATAVQVFNNEIAFSNTVPGVRLDWGTQNSVVGGVYRGAGSGTAITITANHQAGTVGPIQMASADTPISNSSSNVVTLFREQTTGTSWHMPEGIALGTTPATAGDIRLPSLGTIRARNAGDSATVTMMTLDANDDIALGDASGAEVRVVGQLGFGNVAPQATGIIGPNNEGYQSLDAGSVAAILMVLDASDILQLGNDVNIASLNLGAAAIPTQIAGQLRFRATQTLDDTGTPSVSGGNVFVTGGTTAITAFDDGVDGQIIMVISAHSVTITDGASLHLNGGNYAMTDNDTLTLVFDGSEWYETGRAVD